MIAYTLNSTSYEDRSSRVLVGLAKEGFMEVIWKTHFQSIQFDVHVEEGLNQAIWKCIFEKWPILDIDFIIFFLEEWIMVEKNWCNQINGSGYYLDWVKKVSVWLFDHYATIFSY